MAPQPPDDTGTVRAALFGRAPDGDLRAWVGHPDQVAGVEVVEAVDGDARGVRLVRLRTGEIDVDLAVDRALDVVRASVRGVPVGWLSPAGLRHPAYAEPVGFGPLRTFTGGLLTTCGLDHVHGPADTPDPYGHPGIALTHHPLHGRVAALPARLTRAGREGRATLVVEGEVRQATPFGEHLVLTRRIEADLGGRTLRVRDRVRNDGFVATPLAVLYHVNVGWPVLTPDARLHLPAGEVHGAGGAAAERDETVVGAPEPGAREAVRDHLVAADGSGRAHAAITTDDIGDGRTAGLLVSWDAARLPTMTHWSMLGAGMYVVGLEPSSVPLSGVAAAREAGTLQLLAPGEEACLAVDLVLLHGADDVAAVRAAFAARA